MTGASETRVFRTQGMPAPTNSPRWLTTQQVAERIQMTTSYVSRQCAAGQIRATRLGTGWRISESALEAFMATERAQPARVRTSRQRRGRATASP